VVEELLLENKVISGEELLISVLFVEELLLVEDCELVERAEATLLDVVAFPKLVGVCTDAEELTLEEELAKLPVTAPFVAPLTEEETVELTTELVVVLALPCSP
jgi:hypothetical protein